MKKLNQKIMFAFFVFCIFFVKVNARSLNLKEIVERVDSKTDTIYIIGNHVFANHDINLQDIMVGARTIRVSSDDEDFGEDYTDDDVYKSMNIYRVSLEKNPKENFKVVNATVDNLVGETKTNLAWNSDEKVDVDNINYDFVKEESKAKIELYNLDTHSNYQSYFSTKNFDKNEYVKLENLTLSDTVAFDKEKKITPDNQAEKTDYYVGIVVKIDDTLKEKMSDQTTIWYGYTNEKEKATKKIKSEFTEEGIPILWSIKENASDKHLYIWVDLDGDEGNTYETTSYVIDYTNLTFQKVSSGSISKEIDVDESWNYTLDNENLTYTLNDAKYTVTGKVKKQQDVSIEESDESGYYLPFKITTSEAHPKMSIKWEGDGQSGTVTLQDKNTYSFLYPIKKTSIGEDRKCSNCTLKITIDFDGEEGHDYLAQEYTIDYKDVTFQEDSSIRLEGLEKKIIETKESDGKYYFNVKVTPTTIKEGTTIRVTDPNGKVESYTEATPVALETSKSVTITKQDNAYELKLEAMKEFEITSENPKKAYQIEIDIDGEDELYAASTYDINYDEIKTLEEEINNYAKKTQDAKSLKQNIQNKKDGVSENIVETYSKESNSKLVDFQDGNDVKQVYYFEYTFPTEGLPSDIQSWASKTVHFAFTKYQSKVADSTNKILTEGTDVYLNGWLYRKLTGGLGVDILGILQDETIRKTDGSYTKIRAIENIEKQSECDGAANCYKVTLTKDKVETWLNDHYSEGRQTHTVSGSKAVMIKIDSNGYVIKVDSVGDDASSNEWNITYKESSSSEQQIKRTIDVTISNINEGQSELKDPETMIMGSKSTDNQKLFFEFIALGEKLWQQHIQ